jgi:hypothetical protein
MEFVFRHLNHQKRFSKTNDCSDPHSMPEIWSDYGMVKRDGGHSMPDIWSDYGMVKRDGGMVFGSLPRLAVSQMPLAIDHTDQLPSVSTETARRIDRALRWAAMHNSRKGGYKRPQEVMGCRLPDDLLKFMDSKDFL